MESVCVWRGGLNELSTCSSLFFWHPITQGTQRIQKTQELPPSRTVSQFAHHLKGLKSLHLSLHLRKLPFLSGRLWTIIPLWREVKDQKQAGMQDGIAGLMVQTEIQIGVQDQKQALQDGLQDVQAEIPAMQAGIQTGMEAVQLFSWKWLRMWKLLILGCFSPPMWPVCEASKGYKIILTWKRPCNSLKSISLLDDYTFRVKCVTKTLFGICTLPIF